MTFFHYYFFNSKLFLTCFLQFFFIKRSNNFFSFKICNNIFHDTVLFNFFNYKNFFRPVWNIAFCKNVFIFWYSNNINNFKFRILIINFFTSVNVYAWFYISIFILIVLWYVSMYLLTISSSLLIYIFFDIEVIYL